MADRVPGRSAPLEAGAAVWPRAVFAAQELRIGVSLKPLIFEHEVSLRGFQIESPQINLIGAANGTWNLSSIGHELAGSDVHRWSRTSPGIRPDEDCA
jgi:uncharacterized protein involved in outer membrane biogenesis